MGIRVGASAEIGQSWFAWGHGVSLALLSSLNFGGLGTFVFLGSSRVLDRVGNEPEPSTCPKPSVCLETGKYSLASRCCPL